MGSAYPRLRLTGGPVEQGGARVRGRIQNRAKEGTEAPGEGQSMRISGISVRGGSGLRGREGQARGRWRGLGWRCRPVTEEQLCG